MVQCSHPLKAHHQSDQLEAVGCREVAALTNFRIMKSGRRHLSRKEETVRHSEHPTKVDLIIAKERAWRSYMRTAYAASHAESKLGRLRRRQERKLQKVRDLLDRVKEFDEQADKGE